MKTVHKHCCPSGSSQPAKMASRVCMCTFYLLQVLQVSVKSLLCYIMASVRATGAGNARELVQTRRIVQRLGRDTTIYRIFLSPGKLVFQEAGPENWAALLENIFPGPYPTPGTRKIVSSTACTAGHPGRAGGVARTTYILPSAC